MNRISMAHESHDGPNDLVAVEPHRRLISAEDAVHGIEEYYAPDKRWRYLVLAHDTEQAALHHELEQLAEGALVLHEKTDAPQGLLMLDVPVGTRSITGVLPAVSRDIDSYRPIFRRIGGIVGALAVAGHDEPKSHGRGVFDGFAYVADSDETYGNSVVLIPPYVLGQDAAGSFEQASAEQLLGSGYFAVDQVKALIEEIRRGRER